MPVLIGDTPQAGFGEPLRLMSDCHRRVEKFLGVLVRIAVERQGGPLDAEHRTALEAALRYFRNAAPWHTQDEEVSLFPRMRRCSDPRARQAMAQIDALEADHAAAAPLHDGVERLGRRWLDRGRLSPDDAARLSHLLDELRATYVRHIAVEDTEVFPLAGQVLSDAALRAVGREMADRRGVDPDLPPRRCRHRSTTPGAESAQKGS